MESEEHLRGQRFSLDKLVGWLFDSAFVARFRRHHTFRETSEHVDPLMLAVSSPNSLYVQAWRHHIKVCPACARLFAYFGIPQ